jgi:hypothetical protein
MQLIYRGTTFNYDPAYAAAHRSVQRTFETSYELIYRGCTYRIDPTASAETSVKPTVYELTYRGTTYRVYRDEQGKSLAIASSANSSTSRTSFDNRPAVQSL